MENCKSRVHYAIIEDKPKFSYLLSAYHSTSFTCFEQFVKHETFGPMSKLWSFDSISIAAQSHGVCLLPFEIVVSFFYYIVRPNKVTLHPTVKSVTLVKCPLQPTITVINKSSSRQYRLAA